MHSRMLVLLDTKDAPTSWAARNMVDNALEAEGFASYSGIFCEPPADWYVIGGRWSGSLLRNYFPTEDLDRADNMVREQKLEEMYHGDDSKRMEKIVAVFREAIPQASPHEAEVLARRYSFRASYERRGCEEDAMILDQILADKELSKLYQYPYKDGLDDLRTCKCFVYLSHPYKEVTKELIGKVWVVVVDFHW